MREILPSPSSQHLSLSLALAFASSYSNSIPSDHVSTSKINYSCLCAFVLENTFLYLADKPM